MTSEPGSPDGLRRFELFICVKFLFDNLNLTASNLIMVSLKKNTKSKVNCNVVVVFIATLTTMSRVGSKHQ